MTWLLTIARNRAVDEYRRSGRAYAAPIERAKCHPDPKPSALDLIIADYRLYKMRECLEGLATPDVKALKDAFFGGWTYVDLAMAAGMPIGTMKSRIRRALLHLRKQMADT